MSQGSKQRPMAPAQINFQRHEERLRELGLEQRFAYIFQTNLWGSDDSKSGPGSVPEQTLALAESLPRLLAEIQAESMLDIPCGDFGWMSSIDLGVNRYLGADIVEALVVRNQAAYGRDGEASRAFLRLDLTRDDLPEVELVFCRDCLVHLSNENIFRAFANLKRSGSRYLLTTSFTEHEQNQDIQDGDWRLLNFERAPFSLPKPLLVINEQCTEQDGAFADKVMALWRISDLPA